VTLSENLPFTFVDHALKCGDSLVGYSVKEIQAAMQEVQLGFLNEQNQIFEQMGLARRESFANDSLTDAGYDRKKALLREQTQASEGLRQAGDLMVAAFFDAPKAKDRPDKQQVYLALLSGAFNDAALQDSIQDIRERLAAGERLASDEVTAITRFAVRLVQLPDGATEWLHWALNVHRHQAPFSSSRALARALSASPTLRNACSVCWLASLEIG
jgi:hypothetical protein